MIYAELKSLPQEDICIHLTATNYAGAFLCDCGDASLLTVRDCRNVEALFLSHTHIDHFANFDTVLRHLLGTGRTVRICGPAGITQQVQHRLRSYVWNLIQPGELAFEVREIVTDGQIDVYGLQAPAWELEHLRTQQGGPILETEAFTVDYTLLDHGTPVVAWQFREPDSLNVVLDGSGLRGGKWVAALKEAWRAQQPDQLLDVNGLFQPAGTLFHLLKSQAGYRLGVVMDHAATPENHARICDLLGGADKVLIEAYYLNADRDKAVQNRHSYAAMSGQVMRQAGVGEAIPVHFSRRYSEAERAQIAAEFETAWKHTEA